MSDEEYDHEPAELSPSSMRARADFYKNLRNYRDAIRSNWSIGDRLRMEDKNPKSPFRDSVVTFRGLRETRRGWKVLLETWDGRMDGAGEKVMSVHERPMKWFLSYVGEKAKDA